MPKRKSSMTATERLQAKKLGDQLKMVLTALRLKEDLKRAETAIRVYEAALVNIAKLAGACHERGTGRTIHDPAEVAGRALTQASSEFWDEVKDLPYMVLDVEDDGSDVPTVTLNRRKLAAWKRSR